MKAKLAKRIMTVALAGTLMFGSSVSVFAYGDAYGDSYGAPSSSSSSSSSSSKSDEKKVIEIITASIESDGESTGVSSIAELPNLNVAGGAKSAIDGVYIATNVNGTAIVTGLDTIASGYGLAAGEKAYARIYNMDSKKSYLAQAVIDSAAASLGAVVGPAINIEIGKLSGGKFSLLPSDGPAITIKVGIPKSFAQDGKTFAVVAVRPGGAVSILADTDADPNTVTFSTTAGQGAYALIKY